MENTRRNGERRLSVGRACWVMVDEGDGKKVSRYNPNKPPRQVSCSNISSSSNNNSNQAKHQPVRCEERSQKIGGRFKETQGCWYGKTKNMRYEGARECE